MLSAFDSEPTSRPRPRPARTAALFVAGLLLGAFVGVHARAWRDSEIIRHERMVARKAIAAGHALSKNPSPAACAAAASRAIASARPEGRL
jgi:hypothetical protein